MKVNLSNTNKQTETIKAYMFKIEDVEAKERSIENYVEKYIPIFIQAQISDTLHNCLPSKSQKKLSMYEDRRFKELNADVLNDEGESQFEKRKQGVYDLLEQVFKRTSKMSLVQLMAAARGSPVNMHGSEALRPNWQSYAHSAGYNSDYGDDDNDDKGQVDHAKVIIQRLSEILHLTTTI